MESKSILLRRESYLEYNFPPSTLLHLLPPTPPFREGIFICMEYMMSIEREKRTIEKMIKIYCRAKHGSPKGALCPECQELLNYALKKLDLCPFKEEKPTCKKCTVHCYQPEKREKIKEIMRFSGPRLLLYDPFGWLIHEIREKFARLQSFR